MPVSISTCTGMRRLPKPLDLSGVVHHWREPLRHDHVRGAVHTAHHQDGNLDAGVAQRAGLVDAQHRQLPAAGLEQRARDRHRPVAVGVGLHHGEDLAALGPAPRLGEVGAHGREVDGGHGRTVVRHAAPRHLELQAIEERREIAASV
jgi:hypothetical protein